MGGVKKKSMAAMEKSQDSTETAQSSGDEKGRKAKEQKAPPQQAKRFAFLAPKMGEQEMVKALTPLKAITLSSASRALAVNGAVASGVLQALEKKNLIVKVGGFSGHYVWAVQSKPA